MPSISSKAGPRRTGFGLPEENCGVYANSRVSQGKAWVRGSTNYAQRTKAESVLTPYLGGIGGVFDDAAMGGQMQAAVNREFAAGKRQHENPPHSPTEQGVWESTRADVTLGRSPSHLGPRPFGHKARAA